MIPKQDLQGARTPADIDRKYGAKFSEVLGVAEESKKISEESKEIANEAKNDVVELDQSLGQDGIFNRLTNNGKAKGLYRDDEGNIYINADYIKSGTLIAQMVNALNQNGDYVKIENGRIISGNGGNLYFTLAPADATGSWAVSFHNNIVDEDQELRVHGAMQWNKLYLGGVEQDPAPFQVEATGHPTTPLVQLQLPKENGRADELIKNLYVYWKDNGDGSFSPVGYENKLQGG